MRRFLVAPLGALLLVGAPAVAATQIDLTLGASDGDFVNPRPVSLADRQYRGSGSIQFLTTLSDGTYGLADLASFTLLTELRVRPTAAPPGFYATADYRFGLADLTAFQITYAGGAPVSASWTLNSVTPYQLSGGLQPQPASVDFASGGTGVSFYAWATGAKTLVARAQSLDAVFTETPALPEPTVWATLLIGFGALGGALRRSGGRRSWAGPAQRRRRDAEMTAAS